MLKLKQKKINAVCCDMLNLPFKTNFDFIFSAFDSINYLDTEKKLKLFFKNIHAKLAQNGYLIFDVSLMSNSIKHLKKLNRKGKYKGIEFKQTSKLDVEKKLHTNIVEIWLKDGTYLTEIHNQKIYDFYYYFDVIDSANLLVTECFDAFTFNDASEYSDRVQFIVKRKN
jgi:SAM-dependent methyltransferase